ncbi:STAS domain-containing protein [Kushneria aurantia]|uniref:Lipid asymmetry maintenance protein MlaB n=1 Tax=Kushneria aurantia TaxID=504092 RepID=A0ABV6G1S8_9GAMM|nr:STAS domain-containing protein [Kushneria aurantia]
MSEPIYQDDDTELTVSDDTLRLKGAPAFDNAAALAAAGARWLERHQQGSVSFNACDVHDVSSATLSVLLEWLRITRRKGIEVDRIRLSDRMRELVELAELNDVFPSRHTSFECSPAVEAAASR